MTAEFLLIHARKLGLKIEARGENLVVRPATAVTPDLARNLRACKADLLAMLTSPQKGWGAVPPANLPLITIRPKPAPLNRWRIVDYLERQINGNGRLTEWLVRRENEYYDGPGKAWDCADLCYAAARDAACWQLRKTEKQVCELLETIESITDRAR